MPILLSAALFCLAQAKAQLQLPATPAAKLAVELIDVINTGDRTRIRAFIDGHLEDPNKLDDVNYAMDAYKQGGGIQIVGVISSGEPLWLLVKTLKGDHYGRFLAGAGKTPDKLAGYNILPTYSDEENKIDDLPSAKVPSNELPKLFDSRLRKLASLGRFSGALLVAKGKNVIYRHAYGMADRDFSVPNTVDTKFHIASMGKQFTSVAIGQLVEAGKLSFDDTVAKILPDYPNQDAAKKMTVRMLLTHSAGLGTVMDSPKYDRRKKYASQSAYYDTFANDPLLFEPGTSVRYSNAGFILLGAIIEKVSGEDYYDYVQKHIFDPAGMRDTVYSALDETTPNKAVGYSTPDDDPFGMDPLKPNWMFIGWKGNGCGGCYSTVADLLKFSQALRSYKLLGKPLTDLMVSPHVSVRKQGTLDYGYGFECSTDDGTLVTGHTGGGPNSGIAGALSILWDSGYTVVTLANMDKPDSYRFHRKIVKFLLRQAKA